eukprot:15445912-Alexandrium_andersonii.AAC.1
MKVRSPRSGSRKIGDRIGDRIGRIWAKIASRRARAAIGIGDRTIGIDPQDRSFIACGDPEHPQLLQAFVR